MTSPSEVSKLPPPSVARVHLISTTDTDAALDAFRRVYADARLDPDARAPFGVELDAVLFGPVRRVVARWSGSTRIETPGLEDRYVLTLGAQGMVDGAQESEPFEIVPRRRGVMFSPGRPTRLHSGPAYHGHSLVLEKALLEKHFRTLTGRDAPGSITFDGALDFEHGPGVAMLGVLSLFHQELERRDASPLWLLGLRDAVLTSILTNTRHTATGLLDAPPPRVAQGCVRRAEEFIAAHATEPITLADIVAAVDVPERSLRAAFHSCGRTSPTEVLRQHRFDHARRRLQAPLPGTTIARVVADLGLGSPGRFSVEYRKRFGEAPSETLERGLAIAGLPRRRPRRSAS